MHGMFSGAERFNQPLNNWDTSRVTNMSGMFLYTRSFNQDISNWDTSRVTNMDRMFWRAIVFNQSINTHTVRRPDGSEYQAWNTSRVESMRELFQEAEAFNQPLNNWNTSRVRDMTKMFYKAKSFDQDISNWDVSRVTNVYAMFQSAIAMLKKLPHLKIRKRYAPNVNDWKADMYPRDKLFLDFKESRDEEKARRDYVRNADSTSVLGIRGIQDPVLEHMENQPRGFVFQ